MERGACTDCFRRADYTHRARPASSWPITQTKPT